MRHSKNTNTEQELNFNSSKYYFDDDSSDIIKKLLRK